MKRVAILSPLGSTSKAGLKRNLLYAERCLSDSLSRGESPFASHLLYTRVLDDMVPEQRELGLSAGAAWELTAELVVAYVDHGVSAGMRNSIRLSEDRGIPIEMRTIGG